MIKYIEYNSIGDDGQQLIIPVNNMMSMTKTASNYSQEIMDYITGMTRRSDRYYVVVNALGSYEVWGANRNGDAFPESGLIHKSLRTDMGTVNDYGYKTFEYYAKFFKHHCNKNPKMNFGEVLYSYWNPILHRVELIVAIDTVTGADIIEELENGDNVGVSMGAKVKFDRCSVCQHKSTTRKEYCKHLALHMGEIVTHDLSQIWSKELGVSIFPGQQVFAFNDFPKFFDLSRVFIGADRISYILGKAASLHKISSLALADAYGVTDMMVDKFAQVLKKSEIDKEVGALGPDDIDGQVNPIDQKIELKNSIDEKMKNIIVAEPAIPNEIIDSVAPTLPLSTIFSTMLGMGIQPKPQEFQRIILIKINAKPIADYLDENNQVFDYTDNSQSQNIDISQNNFSDTLGKILSGLLDQRSAHPSFLEPRLNHTIIKESGIVANDFTVEKKYTINKKLSLLAGIAALYTGLKAKALGYTSKDVAFEFAKRPWLKSIIGGGILYLLLNRLNQEKLSDTLVPASNYSDVLQNTNFSGKLIKQASKENNIITEGMILGAIVLPGAYIYNSYNQDTSYIIKTSKFIKNGLIKASSYINKNNFLNKTLVINEQKEYDLKEKLLKLK